MVPTGPRSEVFTTVLVNESGKVADWPAHRQRLTDHAHRLRLALPDSDPEVRASSTTAWSLARISYDGKAWAVAGRALGVRDDDIDAVSVAAPAGTNVPTVPSTAIGRLTNGPNRRRKRPVATQRCSFMNSPSWTVTVRRRWSWMRTGRFGWLLTKQGGGRRGCETTREVAARRRLARGERAVERANRCSLCGIGVGWNRHGRLSREQP